eukprot:m.87839 g.87839  ORF g.87839 m.87839 type:complete len:88 (+) comp8791_c5_seq3:87-350(+)
MSKGTTVIILGSVIGISVTLIISFFIWLKWASRDIADDLDMSMEESFGKKRRRSTKSFKKDRAEEFRETIRRVNNKVCPPTSHHHGY